MIAGGESGPKARPIHPEWVRSIRDRCTDAIIAFHFKQWGEWAPGYSHGEGENGPGDTFVNLDGTTGRVWIDDIDGCARNWCGDWGDGSYPMTRRGKHHAVRELDGRTWDEFPNPDGGRASA